MTEYVQKLYDIALQRSHEMPDTMLERYHSEQNIINKPFHLKGTCDTCVILVHGWSSTPYEMRVLGEQLNSEGLGVDAPILSGHGSRPEHLENVTWDQWVCDIEKTYKRIKKQYSKVYIGGMSIGGTLALHVAAKNKDVDGIILMSTPYRLRYEKVGVAIAQLMLKFTKYKRKTYSRLWNKQPSITQLISYQRYPISSAFEVLEAIRQSHEKLGDITQPIFLIQPEKDNLVARDSINNIYKKINSSKKEMRIIKKASHNFMGNGEHSDVFESVVDFVKKN